jgi:CHAT domain-containing protein
VRRLRIAPDGMLTLVPFEALSDGHPLLERFATSYVSAGRDLAIRELAAGPSGPPIVAVSPGARARQAVTIRPAPAGSFRADGLERLEAANQEARTVRKRLPQARLLAEGQATEDAIKQVHSPAVLHIVGHGLVRGDEDCSASPSSPACALSGLDAGERAMSLSAIVLEEAYGRGPRSSQDGFLTALELQSVDLRHSQMLVLSQCRMASGVPSFAEGVHGMRQAAAIAGVKTFVAPLWRVSDTAQESLMDTFYQELSSGQGRAEALRLAKLRLLHNPATRHFLYWAPVILAGDPAPLPARLFVR